MALRREQDIVSLPRSCMSQRLCEMTLASPTRAGDQNGNFLVDESARGQIVDGGSIQTWQPIEVEAFECLLATEVGASHAQAEFLVIAPGYFIMDEQREEFGEGELAINGLAVSRFQRIEDARQAQLFKQWSQFRNGMHGRPYWRMVCVLRQKRPPSV
jgi:hypothetical protein